MYANFAQLGLVLSVLFSLFIPLALVWLNRLNKIKFQRILDNIVILQFIFVSFAFISLCYGYLISDFSLYNVSRNSHVAIPTIYKLSGVWGNHEGSMLLWLFILSAVNIISLYNKTKNIWFTITQIVVLSSLTLYTILKSNPFIKVYPVPLQGNGFNPLLQDIALAIHPPILYIGYITTIIPFAIAISALMNKSLSRRQIEIMRKWTLFSWSFLVLGIALGSWWAYRELGWGGYWFWDPVENASLLPLLTSTALVHSFYINEKLNTNYKWTILLALITFILAILATFFVRSGIVTSVHSFSVDPNKGIFLLKIIALYSIYSLGLFAFRGHYFDSNNKISWASRAGGINVSNVLWCLAVAFILLSLLYPLFYQINTGKQFTVEREFFETSFIPIFLGILLILSLTLPATWQQILNVQYKHFIYSFLVSLIFTIIFYINFTSSLISTAAFFSGILVVIRMIFWLKQKLGTPLTTKFYLIWLIHLAAGLLAVNLSFIETNSKELLVNMHEGQQVKFESFDITFIKKENIAIDNYLSGRVILKIKNNNQVIANLAPEVRYYPVEKKQTSETSTYHNFFYDLYAVISTIDETGEIGIKMYFKPLISFLWIISAVIFICGVLLLFNHLKKKPYAPN